MVARQAKSCQVLLTAKKEGQQETQPIWGFDQFTSSIDFREPLSISSSISGSSHECNDIQFN
jgi:hypothetical protein